MLRIPYVKIVPYPFEVILEQYFDLEHVAHVHPQTLGEFTLVEDRGDTLVFDQRWPADRRGRRAVSRMVQTYRPPGDIWFEITSGRYSGMKVHSQLKPHPQGTEVVEIYHITGLPDWALFRWLVRPWVVRQVERVWEEDFSVGVCIGGWPGVPGKKRWTDHGRPLSPGTYRLGRVDSFPLGSLKTVETSSGQVLIAHVGPHDFRAIHPICPHTGGPLQLGQLDNGCVVCPWHAARFDLATGKACGGPTKIPVPVYRTSVVDGELILSVGNADR